MSRDLFYKTPLQEGFARLQQDLLHDDGPQISTMRNYRFAIMVYDPGEEFKLRLEVQRLSSALTAGGWVVLSISLQQLLLDRIRAQGEDWMQRVAAMEKRTHTMDPERGLNYLRTRLAPHIEGPDGIAADCARLIANFVAQHPDKAERTLAIIGRAGALYPFFRSSALLKHLDGRTQHVPVVLMYPGQRVANTGLKFMGQLDPDNDYRPRIYP